MRRAALPLLLLVLTACETKEERTDADGDGYVEAEDCDDGDPDINPGQDELCDEIDNDCDGAIDEDPVDPSTFHADHDGDGYGDPDATLAACSQPEGYLTDATDCDDDDADSWPGADETCDGQDNDCDGETDEDPVEGPSWYRDADEDGYGDADDSTIACAAPEGYVADATDCDDADASIHPGADDSCDAVDSDCDGEVAEDDSVDAATWYADTDSDGFGDAASTTTSCEQPSGYVSDDTDCDDAESGVNPDALEVCDGLVDEDCDGTVDEDDASDASTWYVDLDDDGYGDADTTTTACVEPSGYVSDDTDCDDSDADTWPGADEYCDDEDDDCDGDIDEGALDADTWYADSDGDGYGDATSTLDACDQPSGYVADDDDCDDTDDEINPLADEVCDSADNDCDGTTDEDDAIDADTWYADTDGDGYGNASSTYDACAAPTGYVDDATDCDDTDEDVYPEAIEFCGNSTDEDCDGSDTTCPDEGDLLITEIMPNPAASSDYVGEWVEIHNTTTDDIALGGLVLADAGVDLHVIDDTDLEVPAGGYVVLAIDATAAADVDHIYSGFTLANTSDEVILAAYGTDGTDGDIIAEVWYDTSSDWSVSAGESMSLDPSFLESTDPVGDANEATSWCDGLSAYSTGDLGTPGAANDDCEWPEITSIDPDECRESGGGDITLYGLYLGDLSTVTIDGSSVSFTAVSSTEVEGTCPAGTAGWVDVVASDGDHERTLEEGFLYTGTTHGVDWGNLQWPDSDWSVASGASTSVYGQVLVWGVTDASGQGADVLAQLGLGDPGTDPTTDHSWVWTDGTYNTDYYDNDEYVVSLSPGSTGDFAVAWRYSIDEGVNWLYADVSGCSSTSAYDTSSEVVLTVY